MRCGQPVGLQMFATIPGRAWQGAARYCMAVTKHLWLWLVCWWWAHTHLRVWRGDLGDCMHLLQASQGFSSSLLPSSQGVCTVADAAVCVVRLYVFDVHPPTPKIPHVSCAIVCRLSVCALTPPPRQSRRCLTPLVWLSPCPSTSTPTAPPRRA